MLAILYNANRGSGQSAVSPDDLNPHKQFKRRRQIGRQRVADLQARHQALASAGGVQTLAPQKVIE